MKTFAIRKIILCAVAATAAVAFWSCNDDDDDNGLPSLEVSPANLSFDAAGKADGPSSIEVKSNRPWRLEMAESDNWVVVSQTSGSGDAVVSVTVPESNTARTATLRFSLYNSYGNYLTREVKISQGAAVAMGEIAALVSYIKTTWPSMESGTEPLGYSKTTVEAVILANNEGGNNFGKLYVGDNTTLPDSGIILYSTTDFTQSGSLNYPVGRRVTLDLSAAQYAPYGNLRELKGVVVTLTDDPAVDVVVPTLTAAMLNSGNYQGQYVRVTGLTPQSEYVGQMWAESSKRVVRFNADGGATVQSYMATASDAPAFAELVITANTGDLLGTAEQNYNNIQLIPTSITDVAAFAETAPEPEQTPYMSQSIFMPTESSQELRYYPSHSTVNGENATGFKLGTSSLSGVYTSAAVGVAGTRTLSLYAVAWRGKTATVYVRVEGGGSVEGASSYEIRPNEGASGSGNDFTLTDITDADRYTFTLTGLTASSTVTISTSAEFAAVESVDSGRAIILGVQLAS